MSILITGAAGFIGFHLSKRLIEMGNDVIGIDNFNNYYDPNLKKARVNFLRELKDNYSGNFYLVNSSLENENELKKIFDEFSPDKVVNLAAQAGVRYSLENPKAYIKSNIVGFLNLLEECMRNKIKNLLYASSSSVYGGNTSLPFSEDQLVDHPVSLYAATKKSNELMAHTYSHLYGIPSTGLRFFTVYGPWGRPDMALFLFTKSIISGETINIYNEGNMIRDFTYIDDVVESLVRLLDKPATPDSFFNTDSPITCKSWAPHRIFNIGNSKPVPLMQYIHEIEKCLGKKAIKNFTKMQNGDVLITEADTSRLEEWIEFRPQTNISLGIANFIKWYKDFYKV